MTLKDMTTADLLEELIRRDAVRILQTSQRVDGAEFLRYLGATDSLRVMAIGMCQRMAAIELQNNLDMQHVTHRKLKTSASEEFCVTYMVVTKDAMSTLMTDEPAEEVPS